MQFYLLLENEDLMEKTVKDSQVLKKIVCELNKDKAMKPFDLEKKLVGSLKV